MTWTVILLVLLVVLAYLLWMPLELCIDTYRGTYYLQMGGLARISVEKDPLELLRLHLKVLFMDFLWRPSDLRRGGKPKKKSARKAHGAKKRKMSLTQGKKLLQTFRIKSFRLELDTGDPVLNARLYPAFFLLGHLGKDVGINFLGRNQILLRISNRPIYILNAFINPKK